MHSLLENYFGFIRRFLPSQPQHSSVGLDIGVSECKLIEIARAGNSFEVLTWAVEPIVGSDVKASVSKILSRVENQGKAPYTSVSGRGTLIRFVELPRMSINDLRQSFAIEADKYFPFAQDQIYTDCYILDPQSKTPQMSVLSAAAKKNIIDQRVKLLSDLHLPPTFIGVDAMALANVVNVLGFGSDEDKNAATALLDIGDGVSSLLIFVNRMPCFSRDIFIGGQDFTKRISNALSLSFKDAENLKMNPKEKLNEVTSATEASMMSIIQEIRISFDYFATEKNREVSRLCLTGGSAMLVGLKENLEKNLEIKVDLWNPMLNLKMATGIATNDINKNSHKLSVALGLALYSYD